VAAIGGWFIINFGYITWEEGVINRNLQTVKNALYKGYKKQMQEITVSLFLKKTDDTLVADFLSFRDENFIGEDYGTALKYADNAINKYTHLADAYLVRGMACSLTGRHKEAQEAFDEAKRLSSDNEDVCLYRGIEYFLVNNYSNAIKDLERALNQKPDILFYRGRCAFLQERI